MSFGAPGGGSVNYKPSPAVAFLLTTKVRTSASAWPTSTRNSARPGKTMDLIIYEDLQHIISGYLKCIKLNKGTNDEACRKLAKEYLACRMDKNLMAPDNFENLGLVFKDGEGKDQTPITSNAGTENPQQKR
ncbi:hypothetical protein N7475_001093 [Penicillium sp. IBT 31633x]|nr:hypothetical protein N7475_001093 [Penicillium sp. IBT 31633x]